MTVRLHAMIVAVVVFGAAACSAAAAQDTALTGRTTARVNLRRGPGVQNPVLIVLPRAAAVTVRQSKGRWRQVVYRSERHGYVGWVYGKYLDTEATSPGKVFRQARLARATADAGLRRAPGPEADVLTAVRRGTHLKVLGREGQWCRVVSENGLYGHIGWVRSRHLSDVAPAVAESLRRGLICAAAGKDADLVPPKPAAAAETASAAPGSPGRTEKSPPDSAGGAAPPGGHTETDSRTGRDGPGAGTEPKAAARAQAMPWPPPARPAAPDLWAGASPVAASGANAGPTAAGSSAVRRGAQWERTALRLCLLVMAALGCVLALGTWRQVHRMVLSPGFHS